MKVPSYPYHAPVQDRRVRSNRIGRVIRMNRSSPSRPRLQVHHGDAVVSSPLLTWIPASPAAPHPPAGPPPHAHWRSGSRPVRSCRASSRPVPAAGPAICSSRAIVCAAPWSGSKTWQSTPSYLPLPTHRAQLPAPRRLVHLAHGPRPAPSPDTPFRATQAPSHPTATPHQPTAALPHSQAAPAALPPLHDTLCPRTRTRAPGAPPQLPTERVRRRPLDPDALPLAGQRHRLPERHAWQVIDSTPGSVVVRSSLCSQMAARCPGYRAASAFKTTARNPGCRVGAVPKGVVVC